MIFIIGLIVILWPVIGGAIASLFNGIVIGVSCPSYWIMRFIKSPKDAEEGDRISNAASSIAMLIVLTAIFVMLIILSFRNHGSSI